MKVNDSRLIKNIIRDSDNLLHPIDKSSLDVRTENLCDSFKRAICSDLEDFTKTKLSMMMIGTATELAKNNIASDTRIDEEANSIAKLTKTLSECTSAEIIDNSVQNKLQKTISEIFTEHNGTNCELKANKRIALLAKMADKLATKQTLSM